MKILEHTAKSIGDLFHHKLNSHSYRGEVHSVFKTVINITLDGELYSIGKAKIGNGPHNLLLSSLTDNLDTLGCKVGDPVTADEEWIRISCIHINLKETVVWSSKWRGIPYPERMFRLLPQLKALAIREGDLDGLGVLLLSEEDFQKSRVGMEYTQQILTEQASPLIEDIRKSLIFTPGRFWSDLLEMVGLGPGLTPAGDDFIVGFILTLRYLEDGGYLKLPPVNIKAVTEQVKRDTNIISATGVLQAIEGRPLELVGDVIENIFAGSKVNTILSALRLMDRGSTSGTDTLTGIIVAGEIFQKIYRVNWKF